MELMFISDSTEPLHISHFHTFAPICIQADAIGFDFRSNAIGDQIEAAMETEARRD